MSKDPDNVLKPEVSATKALDTVPVLWPNP
jgi:hypothetical protein